MTGPTETSVAASEQHEAILLLSQPTLQLIYDTAPIGLACLSPDCRYLQINQRLTEICGISVENHLGRFVRDCMPALADSVAQIVRSIMETGEPVVGVEVAGQRADQAGERFWMTYWHPLRAPNGDIVAINVAAEEITERKRLADQLQSLGQLAAGIGLGIENPLTFINNFASLSAELVDELEEGLASARLPDEARADTAELTSLLKVHLKKIVQHGRRADSIIKDMMLQPGRAGGERRPADTEFTILLPRKIGPANDGDI